MVLSAEASGTQNGDSEDAVKLPRRHKYELGSVEIAVFDGLSAEVRLTNVRTTTQKDEIQRRSLECMARLTSITNTHAQDAARKFGMCRIVLCTKEQRIPTTTTAQQQIVLVEQRL